MSRTLSQEEFESAIFKIYNDEYTVVSQYVGGKKPIKVYHKNCGNVFVCNSAANFKNGKSKCPYCFSCSNAINDDIFKYKINKLVGEEYEALSKYEKSIKPITFRHTKCCHPNGYFDFQMTPHAFLQGHRCPYETHQHGYTIQDYKERLHKYHPDYKCIGPKYINSSSKIDVECSNHHIFGLSLDNIKNSCPFCSNQKIYKGYNDLWTTHPHIAKLLKNPDDGFSYMYGTNNKLDFICPSCGGAIHKKPYLLLNIHKKVICPCQDGFSYPEKFIYNLFVQLKIDFIYQLSKSTFGWCDKYKYDFFLPSENLIVEVHGRQHYDGIMFCDPKEVQTNDEYKYKLAIQNGCKYCVIDARFSTPEFILKSIKQSILFDLFKMQSVNWSECDKFASKSILFDIVDSWNYGLKNIQAISKKFKVSDYTTYRYLEKGSQLNLCDFNRSEYANNARKNAHKGKIPNNNKAVMSIETRITYNSIAEAKRLCKAYLTPEIIGNPNRTSAKQHWIYV